MGCLRVAAIDPTESSTIVDILRLAGRAPDAAKLASDALRAAAARSPVIAHRVRRAVEAALADRSVEWTDEEREQLGDALSVTPPLEENDEDVRRRLSALVASSGLPMADWAVILGVNVRSLRRWLGGQIAVNQSVAVQLAAIVDVRVTVDEIAVRYRRR